MNQARGAHRSGGFHRDSKIAGDALSSTLNSLRRAFGRSAGARRSRKLLALRHTRSCAIARAPPRTG